MVRLRWWGGLVLTTFGLAVVASGFSDAALADKDERHVRVPLDVPSAPPPAAVAPAVVGIEAAIDRLQQSGRLANLSIDWTGLKSFYANGAPAVWVTPTGYSALGFELLRQVPKAAAAGMPVAAEIQSALASLPMQLSPEMPADVEALMSALYIAGGVESMSRAPFVTGKADSAFSRSLKMEDTTMGWRFINPQMRARFGVETMPETAENVARDFAVSRADQDAFALRSQQRTARAQELGLFDEELIAVSIPQRKGEPLSLVRDEHPRSTSLAALSALKGVVRPEGSVTAGNASGINDGASALLIASERAAVQYGLAPLARVVGMSACGVEPRIMGYGPVPAVRKVLAQTGLSLAQMDVIELNEAFAAQALAVTRALGLPDDAEQVNPNGGAIALGHPLGASGGRLAMTAAYQLRRTGGRFALCTMCVGVGQGVALILERI